MKNKTKQKQITRKIDFKSQKEITLMERKCHSDFQSGKLFRREISLFSREKLTVQREIHVLSKLHSGMEKMNYSFFYIERIILTHLI